VTNVVRYLNDRFLLKGQRLRILMLAPEMGVASPRPGAAPLDLGFRFALVDDNGRTLGGQAQRPFDAATLAHLRVPFAYAEFDTTTLNPGTYRIRALDQQGLQTATRVTILDVRQYGAVAQMILEDQAGAADGDRFATTEDVARDWVRSWTELFQYLGVVTPQHVVALPQPLSFGSSTLGQVRADWFRFASFHLNRLAFDQLFYGGTVALQQVEKERWWFRLVLQSRVKPTTEPGESYLNFLRQMLKDNRFSVDVTWKIEAAVPPFAQQMTIEARWRLPGSAG
jgi:hypothetical protein